MEFRSSVFFAWCIAIAFSAALCLKNPWQPLRPARQCGKESKAVRPAVSPASNSVINRALANKTLQYRANSVSIKHLKMFRLFFSSSPGLSGGFQLQLDNMARWLTYLYQPGQTGQPLTVLSTNHIQATLVIHQSDFGAPNKAGFSSFMLLLLVYIWVETKSWHSNYWPMKCQLNRLGFRLVICVVNLKIFAYSSDLIWLMQLSTAFQGRDRSLWAIY